MRDQVRRSFRTEQSARQRELHDKAHYAWNQNFNNGNQNNDHKDNENCARAVRR